MRILTEDVNDDKSSLYSRKHQERSQKWSLGAVKYVIPMSQEMFQSQEAGGWVSTWGKSHKNESFFLYSPLSFTFWRVLEIRNSIRWVVDPLWLLFCPETESLDNCNSTFGKREGAKHLPSRETLKKRRVFC